MSKRKGAPGSSAGAAASGAAGLASPCYKMLRISNQQLEIELISFQKYKQTECPTGSAEGRRALYGNLYARLVVVCKRVWLNVGLYCARMV